MNSFQLPKSETKHILQKASKVAISCSYHIFNFKKLCRLGREQILLLCIRLTIAIFFITLVLVLLPVALSSPPPCEVATLAKLFVYQSTPCIVNTCLCNICNEGISLSIGIGTWKWAPGRGHVPLPPNN